MTRTRVRAAVLRDVGELRFETVHVDQPQAHEVRVRPTHVGLCHSDLHYVDGTHSTQLPEVLGHEVAGVIESVGTDVSDLKAGDRVVTSLTMFCGVCRQCVVGRLTLCEDRARLRSRPRPALVDAAGAAVGTMGGVGGFSELLVVHRNGVVAVPASLSPPVAALFGCAVLTGVGAVTRSAKVPVGATVAVVGCGGIGLAAILGAGVAGASRIVAIDRDEEKLAVARRFGATDAVLAGDDVTDRVRELLSTRGVEYSFEAVGHRATVELAFELLAPGGVCTVLGMVPDSTPIRIPPSALFFEEKSLTGAFIGASRFTVDVPQLTALYQQGRLPLDDLISHMIPFDELVEATALLASGQALRIIIEMPTALEETSV